jgi:hypothetical protein
MSVNLRDELRSIGRDLSTEAESQSSKFGVFVIAVDVVEIASGSVGIDVTDIESFF